MAKNEVPAIVQQCMSDFDEDSSHHDIWINKVDKWYKSWRGDLDFRSDAAQWRTKFHPPYLLQIIETLCAGVIDPTPKWKVVARPRMDTPQSMHTVTEGAKALQYLLQYQRDVEQMILKQRPHRLQGLIAGLSVWKTRWETIEESATTQEQTVEYDEATGTPRLVQQTVDTSRIIKDGPCVDVVDVRDFIWPESARNIPEAPRIFHRNWMDFDFLKKLEAAGYYSNVDQLKETKSFTEQLASREQDLFSVDRTKDKIEVLECWIEGGERVVTIANRKVLLRDKPNPFRHGSFPFIACSPIPELFRIPGVSIVELVCDLQEMLWTIQGQRLDNLELINNAIVLLPEDTLDETGFVFAPGEQWLVPSKDAAGVLQMPTFPAEISLNAENLIKADIQNIPGASPALLGQTAEGTQTATEVSLLTNLAQRRLASQKFQFTYADTQVAEHWISLNQQFLSEDQYISIVGADGEEGFMVIHPEDFRDGNFYIEIAQLDESLIRQERLAEAQARLTVAAQVAPILVQTPNPVNIRAFVEDYLEAAGVQDMDRYFTQNQGMMGGGMPNLNQATGAEPSANGGSAPQATDANSPSNQFSQSPAAMMQQFLATQGGGPNNS